MVLFTIDMNGWCDVPKSERKSNQDLNVRIGWPGDDTTWPGTIHSFERGLLRIQSSRSFKVRQAVVIYIGACQVLGDVVYSAEKEGSFRTAISLVHSGHANRRAERRIPVSWPARVVVIGQNPGMVDSEVVDISSSGLCILSPTAVGLTARIAVETEVLVCFGEVLRCRTDETGAYRLGVRLEEMIGSVPPLPALSRLQRLLRALGC
jgi:hypothetical protein